MKLFGISFGKKKSDDDDDWDDDDDDDVADEDLDAGLGAAGEAGDDGPADDDPDVDIAEEVDSEEVGSEDAEEVVPGGEEDVDLDDDDWDDDDDEDDEESGGAGKVRLIAIGAASLVVLAAAGGGAWWFLGGDAPAPSPSRAKSEGPRVVMDMPPKSRTGGGLLSPPARTALTPVRPGQDQAAAPRQAAPGAAPSPDGPSVGAGTPTGIPAGTPAGGAPGSLNAVSSSIREPGAGIVIPAVTQVAFAAIPAAAPAQPLAAVPDPALIEQSPQGPLPKIGEDGRMAWQAYAGPFEDDGKRPRIAVIIGGLGLSRAATEAAVGRLPGAVTLAFDPYARGLGDWVSLARQAGHEVLLSLPMEPAAFPLYDPGPLALLTTLEPEANLGRLTFLLSRIPGYVGVVSVHGSQFTAEERQIRPILEFLKQRGLMYVDNGGSRQSLAPRIASEIGLPSTVGNLNLDVNLSRSAIDSRLARLEETAHKNKTAVAMASPYPVIVERLAAWIGTLDKKGLVLAPVSSFPVKTAAPPTPAKTAKP